MVVVVYVCIAGAVGGWLWLVVVACVSVCVAVSACN